MAAAAAAGRDGKRAVMAGWGGAERAGAGRQARFIGTKPTVRQLT